MGNYRIFPALHEEAKEGWIWLPRNPDISAAFVHVCNTRENCSIVCERRTIDENFRDIYNSDKRRLKLPESGAFIVMNAWYREQLKILDSKAEIPLQISNATGWWASYRAFRLHPSPAIRVTVLLAVISLVLGIAGFVEGIVGLFKR